MYMASSMAAGALMVIEVETLSRGMPSNRAAMSSRRGDGHAHLAHLAGGHRVIRVIADLGGQVEGHREAGLALLRAGSGSGGWIPRRWPKPAYWRMVQRRPRYIVGCTPRVKGYSPGKPTWLDIITDAVWGQIEPVYGNLGRRLEIAPSRSAIAPQRWLATYADSQRQRAPDRGRKDDDHS